MLLGLDESVIKAEYSLTAEHWDALHEEHNERRRKAGFSEVDQTEFPADETDLMAEHLDSKYKGIEAYLSSIDLTHEEMRMIRANFLQGVRVSEKLVDVDEKYV